MKTALDSFETFLWKRKLGFISDFWDLFTEPVFHMPNFRISTLPTAVLHQFWTFLAQTSQADFRVSIGMRQIFVAQCLVCQRAMRIY